MTSTDCKDLLDHLVGALLKMQRHIKVERLGGLEVRPWKVEIT
jgi:hypothetical protein